MSLKYQPSEEDVKLVENNIDKFKNLTLIFSNEHLRKIKERN
jgi:hypothetical protein